MKMNYSKYSNSELYGLLKEQKPIAEAAFAELYSRLGQRIYAYCLRITGHQEEAQDIYQESFLKFYASAREGKKVDNVSGFIIRIARNLCLNYKFRHRTKINFDDYSLEINETSYEQKELLELIAGALELLDFDHREVFILRQYHGLSYHEISEITGDSEHAIKSRVWRAKEKVKNILAPYMEDLSK
jgi:RNA polymerase sigma-70 factor, ECF subfamily